ncbi:protein kish, partial [Ipomoea triloba]|uniref:protein kish n=1 Tax=Ipomoea triloba TaxID=35885 RepID=UPI00125D053A
IRENLLDFRFRRIQIPLLYHSGDRRRSPRAVCTTTVSRSPPLQLRIEGSPLGKLKYVVLLGICTCTYVKMHFPALLEQRTGFRGFFWKAARIGERLSPWVAVGCLTMGVSIIFF